jgi:hypothetical protein
VNGLYTALWNQKFDTFILQYATLFSDSSEDAAKAKKSPLPVLTNFTIREVILKENNGFILTAEDYGEYGHSGIPLLEYPKAEGNSYPYLFSNPNYNRGFESNYFNNILILNFNDTLGMPWVKVIHKSQFDSWYHWRYLSYFMMNDGSTIHFLFDEDVKHKQLTYEQTIEPGGKLSDKLLLRGLNFNYSLMPSFATQVSSYEIIVPCTFRNYFCFAKIAY